MCKEKIIKVFHADQYQLVRNGLKTALKEYSIEIIGEAKNVKEMMDGLAKCQPDLLITSHKINEDYASSFLPLVKEKFPKLKILMLTLRGKKETLLHYVEYIDGLLSLESGTAEIVQAILAIVKENKLYYIVNTPTGKPYESKSKRMPLGDRKW